MLGSSKKPKERIVDSLIGQGTEIRGDLIFSGGLHVDGKIVGNVFATEGSASVLTVSEQGIVEGEIRVPEIILNGAVTGDVYGGERIELAPKARINGNVYYNLIEVAIGAEVNGKLVHTKEPPPPPKALTHQKHKADEHKHTGLSEKTHDEPKK